MTDSEKQNIIDAVLSAIRTNSRTINQLTPVTSLNGTDFFEVSGGRRVSFSTLVALIASLSEGQQGTLQQAIERCVLSSASVTVTDTTATLSISSYGKTITTTIPVATDTKVGLITPLEKAKISSGYDTATIARDKASTAEGIAREAKQLAESLNNAVGSANGIAPLDGNGRVPAANLPGFVDDVIEFDSLISGITIQLVGTSTRPTDENAAVFYDTDSNQFVLGVMKVSNVPVVPFALPENSELSNVEFVNQQRLNMQQATNLRELKLAYTQAKVGGASQGIGVSDFGQIDAEFRSHFTYYNAWPDRSPRFVVESDKIYVATATNQQYRWSGSQLTVIGSDLALGETASTAYPGNKGKANANAISGINIKPFDFIVDSLDELTAQYYDDEQNVGGIVYSRNDRKFYRFVRETGATTSLLVQVTDYNNGGVPNPTVLFRLSSPAELYHYNTLRGELISFIDEFKLNADIQNIYRSLQGVLIVNANAYYDSDEPLYDLQTAISNLGSEVKLPGVIVTFLVDEEGNWESYQWKGSMFDSSLRWENVNAWQKFGASSSTVGNVYNATAEDPLGAGLFYTLDAAIAKAYEKGYNRLGIGITFEERQGQWQSYQYTGPTTDWSEFRQRANWLNNASLNKGSEPFINIKQTFGDGPNGGYYTLGYAIVKIIDNDPDTKYRKSGLVIHYPISEFEWETKKFQGPVSSFANENLWADFGGGSQVTTSPTPVAEGTDAFSTGGAAELIPISHEVVQDGSDVSIQFKNSKGEDVMDPIHFIASQGGGGEVGGTNIVIKVKKATVYAALDAELLVEASIRSVTTAGSNEQENNIEKIEIVDKSTNQVLKTWTGSRESSVSDTDYSFVFDLKDLFSAAGEKSLKLVVTDELGKTNSKSFKAVAENATLTCKQVLNFDPDNVIRPDADSVGFDCYEFTNAASDIHAYVDILIDGEWVNIHDQICSGQNRNVTRRVIFSPSTLGLQHGAYQIRMYGVTVESGVRGNTVYSGIMVVDPDEDSSMVVLRYNDLKDGTIMNYETVELELAAYKPGNATGLIVDTAINGTRFSEILAMPNNTYKISKQITGYADDTELTIQSHIGAVFSEEINLVVSGSAVDVALKEGSTFNFDFAGRNNNEPDHSIVSGDVSLTVNGANYTTNGFNKYQEEDTDSALRFAENVTGVLNYQMYAPNTLEATGAAIQFKFLTDNIRDKDALLMECYDPTSGAGFYVKGNEIAIFCRNGVSNALERRSFSCGKTYTAAVVVEPSSRYITRSGIRYSSIYLYIDGEKVAKIGYVPGNGHLLNQRNITFNGTNGDFYLYNIATWRTYFEWHQAMGNYLARRSDVVAMVEEFNRENVLASQTAEGVTEMRPQHAELWNRGIPYVVEVASQDEFDKFDGLDQFKATGENTGSGEAANTSTNFTIDLYYYDPRRPWRSFIAYGIRKRRQGTTSAKRAKKNPRYYLGKASRIVPMFPNYAQEHQLTTAQLKDLNDTYALFAMKYVRVGENSMPVQTITIKIDFSDATGANDCGVCDMANSTFRAMGRMYMTPGQRAYNGRWDKGDVHLTGIQMNHSTANHPCAIFRCTDTTLSNVFFEAKGNWKEDKAEQNALGFMNIDGYNKGCVNYQDEAFVEVFAPRGVTLEEYMATSTFQALQLTWDTEKLYLLSPYCGRNYKFFRYQEGQWRVQRGSMRQVNGQWQVEGTVLNPVDGYELIVYDGFCWWQGVSSVDDMMAPTTEMSSWVKKLVDKGNVSATQFPMWTRYFECMVENDQLQIDLAMGRKVPFNLYNMLRAFDAADYSKVSDWRAVWRNHMWKYMSVRSAMAYHGLTDYNALFDQRAKNMQPMFWLEDGHCVVDGVYDPTESGADSLTGFNYEYVLTPNEQPMIMYLNKVYDADGANGADNDGGFNADPETNPDVMSEDNPYKGWGSILFVDMAQQQEMVINAEGETMTLSNCIGAMRECEVDLEDGSKLRPFSPAGAIHYFCTLRTEMWPKNVSSYDGYRKYEKYTESSDTIYFYALQGLRRASLPQFITTRWRYRDGFYKVGDFYGGVISGRSFAPNGSRIKIVASKSGYFGLGNDASGMLAESVYLEAGQTHYFTRHKTGSESLLYIYQADRLKEIDLSEIALANDWSFDNLKLVERFILGSETYVSRAVGSNALLSNLPLGSKPFLDTLDIRGREITSVNASGCPRIAHIYAQNSQMASLTLAETSPINDIGMPAGMVDIRFIGLPQLTYNGLGASSGLQIPSLAQVQTLILETSPNLNAMRMLKDVLAGQTGDEKLRYVRVSGMSIRGNGADLLTLIERGVQGIDGNAVNPKPIINGTYMLERILEQSEVDQIEAGIQGITVAIVIEAYIDRIDEVNGDTYSGASEVEGVSLDNIGEHMYYYNGEYYEDVLARIAESNISIHQIILN